MQPKPIIYCETNWIVSLAFQHHQKHKEASELLERARAGEFELRLPIAAILEAPRPIEDEARQFTKTWDAFRAQIQHAFENGHTSFDAIFRTIIGADKSEKAQVAKLAANYTAQQQSRHVIRELQQSQHIQILSNPNDAIQKFTDIRSKLAFKGADTVDLFILAHVLADRANEPCERPAILLSLDEKAFDPTKGKLDEEFYKENYLAWSSSFNFPHAIARWNEWFQADSSTSFDSSSVDAMISEFSKCLQDVSNPGTRARFEHLFHKNAHVFFGDDSSTLMNLMKPNQLPAKLKLESWNGKVEASDGVSVSSSPTIQKFIDCEATSTSTAPTRHRFVLSFWFDGKRYWVVSLEWSRSFQSPAPTSPVTT